MRDCMCVCVCKRCGSSVIQLNNRPKADNYLRSEIHNLAYTYTHKYTLILMKYLFSS